MRRSTPPPRQVLVRVTLAGPEHLRLRLDQPPGGDTTVRLYNGGTLVVGALIARTLLNLYYDPPTMSPPGEGFKAIQAFWGWGAGEP